MSTTRALQLFQVLRLGAVILTSVLLAKSGMPMADIGAYEMLLYVGTVLTFFWVNGLLQGLAPMYGQLSSNDRKAFVFNQFLVFCGLSLLVCGLLFVGQKFMLPALIGRSTLPYYGFFCLYLLFNLPTFPVEYIYLLTEKPFFIAAWGVVSFGLQVAAVFVPLHMGYGLEGGIICLAGLGGLKFAWTLGLVLNLGQPVFRLDLIRQYLFFSLPLTLNVIVGNLIPLFDNWLVSWHFQDEALFAVFRYGSRELPLATALATALSTAMIPRLTQDFMGGLAELKTRTRRLMHLLFPLTIALLFLAKPMFPIVFNPDFAASAPLFTIYLLMTASRVLLPNALILAKGEPAVIFRTGLLELAVKIALGFLFIQWFGLPGVAWSAVLAFWVEKIGLMWHLRQKHGIHASEWLDWKWYGGYVAALAASFWVAYQWG